MALWLIYRADPIGTVEARDRTKALEIAERMHPQVEVRVRSKVAAELADEDLRTLRQSRRFPNQWTHHKGDTP